MSLSRDEAKIREKAIRAMYFQLYRVDKHRTTSKLRLADISTLVLNYFDNASGTTINSRADQDVKNANNVTISALGEIKWTLQTADTTVQGSAADGELEKHVAVFKWVTSDGLSDNMRINLFIIAESKV